MFRTILSDKNIVRKSLFAAGASLLFAVLVAAYALLPLTAPARSASPDENANRHFATVFARTGTLWQFDSINLVGKGMIHPRSTRVVDDFIVPGGFLGLPVLYGGIAAALGTAVLPYLTPVFAALAVIAWGLLIARLFGRRVGLLAAFLLALHPMWWYETARTLQPNVLFLSLVIASAWLFVAGPLAAALHSRVGMPLLRRMDAPLAGLCFGLALAVRPSELYWLAIVGVIAVVWYWRHMPWREVAVAALFGLLALAPFLYFNQVVYGSIIGTGYGAALEVPVADLPQGKGAALIGPLQPALFPLGFAPRSAFGHFADFGIGLEDWWSVLVACGLAALVIEAWRLRRAKAAIPQAALAFGSMSLAVALWLILFYGSWTVRDNPDPTAVTIGSSYLRYWLPIFVLSTVPVAWLAARASFMLAPRSRRVLLFVFLAAYAVSATHDVLYSPQEGLLATRASLFDEDAKAAAIIAATPPKAIIVVDRADKYLFPERRVMVPLRSDATYAALGRLRHSAPLFYFGITFPQRDLDWLSGTKLPPLGLTIVPVKTIGQETLYRFDPVDQSSDAAGASAAGPANAPVVGSAQAPAAPNVPKKP